MTNFLTNLAAFIVLISILVAVHEYGHYIVGRWMGMKVLRFSIGFGKPIWTRVGRKDETEYCVAAIPLGGYVRFLDSREGAVDPGDEGRAFDQRPILARIAVLLAGPMFNFLLAILLFWVLLPPGQFQSLKPVVGTVTADSYAARAGLQSGDVITAVGNVEVYEWEPALQALLTDVVDDGQVTLALQDASGNQRKATLDVGDNTQQLTEPSKDRSLFDELGFQIWQAPAVIADFTDVSAARRAGMLDGDRIIAIDDVEIRDSRQLAQTVAALAGKAVKVGYVRAGEEQSVNLIVGSSGNDAAVGRLGVQLEGPPETYYRTQTLTLAGSLQRALVKTWDTSAFTVTMLGRMVTGDVSIKNISGPINIAQIAGESVERGWRYAVYILAVISISLGVLNLLPVPVLDGGQIVYQVAEGIKGSPLSERTQIIGQQIGIFALLVLMSFAFYNDIARSFQ